MPRAFILLLDSFGIGASHDAHLYGDGNADTLGNIAAACANQQASDGRKGPLQIPNLCNLGLATAYLASTGKTLPGINIPPISQGLHGYAVERSHGKDTPSGHWEIAGVPVLFDWGYFPHTYPSFPETLLQDLVNRGQLPGVLGNCHASGTTIINELGAEHLKTGKPIVYTSGDSVFQIAAHEQSFGLQRLYDLCAIARQLVDEYHIGRVIARPFLGEAGNFYRTSNRRDLATPPPAPTLLDKLSAMGREVITIGKVADIFAHQGITQIHKAANNGSLFDTLLSITQTAVEGSLTFVNFVDFDTLYGHRRNVSGYACALEAFDQRLPDFIKLLKTGDLAIITADHGCDPTQPGSDHTREHIPVLAFGPNIPATYIGRRDSFADIGQSIARHLKIDPLPWGIAFL
jgi:phosphopentomutase